MGERFERLERFGRNAERFARNDWNRERNAEQFARNDFSGAVVRFRLCSDISLEPA